MTNTGTVSAASPNISDATYGTVTCPAGTVAPGASVTCGPLKHTITQSDVDAGIVSNTATAQTEVPEGGPVRSASSSVDVPVAQSAAMTVLKQASVGDINGNGATDVGDTITWTFTVTNTGSVTLTSVGVTDPMAGRVTCPVTTLNPGASTVCTAAVHTVTQAEVDAGVVSNTASATAVAPNGLLVDSPEGDANASVTTPIASTRALRLTVGSTTRDVNGDGRIGAGDQVTWSYTITNTGTTTMTDVQVVTPSGLVVTCPVTTLAPEITCYHGVSGASFPLGLVKST